MEREDRGRKKFLDKKLDYHGAHKWWMNQREKGGKSPVRSSIRKKIGNGSKASWYGWDKLQNTCQKKQQLYHDVILYNKIMDFD